jgi:tetratricopeptide (TPR) repeat protein
MADDSLDDDAEIPPGSGGINPAALDAATAGPAASTDEARGFLREQKRLTRLQAKILHEQHALELSHMRWRRFNDQMKGALQIMAVALAIFVVVAIAAAVYGASQADGLVIEAFSVPPSYLQTGVTGKVVADAITAKLLAIRRVAIEHSFSATNDVSADLGDEVRVEIPETGISISEAVRYLRNWLGHERHVSGSVSELAHGHITVAIDLAGAAPISVTGADLGALEDQIAEKVFAQIDPVNTVIYLGVSGRSTESYASVTRYAPSVTDPAMASDAYGLWSDATANVIGDIPLAVARARLGIALDPKIAVTHLELADHLSELGHDEEALKEYRAVSSLNAADQAAIRQERAFAVIRGEAEKSIAYLQGDYASDASADCGEHCTLSDKAVARAEAHANQHDPREAGRLLKEALSAGDVDAADASRVRTIADADQGDWRAARLDVTAAIRSYTTQKGREKSHTAISPVRYEPSRAKAEAHLGLFAEAHRTIDATPHDCYDCDRARGTVDALEGKRDAAAFWYAQAVAEAPSIPFAYADWGEMLLHKGDYDAAIGKLKLANDKGPHFADPLEMWGEALMQKNRSDVALAKFEEADRYAPNWGHLHLKWGEALFYAGHRDEAKKQFAIAGGLDLSQADKTTLMKWTSTHG